ncbi:unnamed protein product [Rhizophagus irregularis]|uniref:Fido domain-containing protein n=1 Tax=Rhizophagus irregularis TaxID=588596 RepID=A0A2I1H3B6_9GLOM|nr:hypothetical protein RhiirA4_447591 [Rhizophagus irregularis]CAB4402345.1 unnamed protein product [Rhizophagus irregularis]
MVDVRAGGFHLTVYPCSIEVPALMERFIQFRNECIKNASFHPLLIACRILSAFLHIHPFTNGNGRVGRSIMTLYLIRNGYPPNGFEQITQKEALFLAQAMKEPTLLYDMITQKIFKILLKYQK